MKKKIKIAELLPNKENYSLNNAAAASIWAKDFNKSYFSITFAQTFLLISEANFLSSCPSLSLGYKLINFLASTNPKTLSPKNSKISLLEELSFEKLL